MALITCPECAAQISDKAPSCPKCACPITAPFSAITAPAVQTIQQTSKSWKAQQLFAGLTFIGSFFLFLLCLASGSSGGSALFLVGTLAGIVWYLTARILAWWHHG